MLQFTTATTEDQLNQILELQYSNLPEQLSEQDIKSDGFLTCRHDLDLMRRMNTPHPHIIALEDDHVQGYALVLRQEMKGSVPILDPLFAKINTLKWNGQAMNEWSFFVMGQICVAKSHRGQGVFSGLYQKMREEYATTYQICITEVSARNARSQQAHEKVGWETAHSYTAPDGHPWNLLVWHWC